MRTEDVRNRKNNKKDNKSSEDTKDHLNEKDPNKTCVKNPKKSSAKYGPMPTFHGQKAWSRGILFLGVFIYALYIAYVKNQSTSVLARQDKVYASRGSNIDCSKEYLEDISRYPGCIPKVCGRHVTDQIVNQDQVRVLLDIAKKGMALGGSNGGATIMDLHSGALSYKDKFVNIYTLPESFALGHDLLMVYKSVRAKIQHAIAESFGLDEQALHLTYPTFFSRLTNKPAVAPNDEYWHVHIDKETYETFHYTSLLYLSDFNIDFKGGRFIYADAKNGNVTVEPRKGRVSFFTSGSENPHYVEKVTEGERDLISLVLGKDLPPSLERLLKAHLRQHAAA